MINKNSEIVIKQIFKHFKGLLKKKEITNGTVNIMGASLILDPSDPRLSYGSIRPFNQKYADLETKWYMSLDRSIIGHDGIENNKTWSAIASDSGNVNSNYGYLVYAPRTEGHSQFEYAVDSLVNSYNGRDAGRQSMIYYAGPDMQVIWNDNIHAKHDFTCTAHTQHFIYKNKLYYIVSQRSSDAIFGLTYDFYHHCHVFNHMLKELNDRLGKKIKPGHIQFQFGSIHLYERHWDLVNRIVEAYNNKEL